MSSRPKISVIVPVYNVEKYLDNCIKSIVRQTYDNLEILLVDDGSKDNSGSLCDEWAIRDNRIKVIHKQNGGASSARNAGLDAATGEYIGFVDADDYIDIDMYEIMYAEICEHNADAASCGMVRESKNGYKEEWGSADSPVECVDTLSWLKAVGEANGILPVHTGNKLYSAEILKNVRFNTNFKYAEDTLFNFEAARNMRKIVIHNVARYHYTNNETSASNKAFSEARFDEHRVMDIIFGYAKSNSELMPYCVKGDVMKSFRTIKQMFVSSSCTEYYPQIRKRIIEHKSEIFKSNLYARSAKLRTLILWLVPRTYSHIMKIYGTYSAKKYSRLSGAE